MPLLSNLYNVTLKRDYRGVAAKGYVRPTVTQFYTCNKPFYLIQSRANITVRPNIGEDIIFNDKIQLSEAGEYTVTTDKEANVYCKLWGAAGGGFGGVGGYTYGELTLQPDTIYKIWVGGGGRKSYNTSTGMLGGFGGGGLCGRANTTSSPYRHRGSGGGLTGIFISEVVHNNSILIAGAGGGACYGFGRGGNGGGLTGGRGASTNAGGGYGGTQINGGAKGNNTKYNSGGGPGGRLYGGPAANSLTTRYSGGGGGSGYYGGGPGGSNNYSGAYGGGGSSFIHSTLVQNGQTIQLSARGGDVPNNNDPDYINNAGNYAEYDGNDGLFVISIIS